MQCLGSFFILNSCKTIECKLGPNVKDNGHYDDVHRHTCNALFNYLIILLDDMVYVYILYDFDDYVTYLWRICDVWRVIILLFNKII